MEVAKVTMADGKLCAQLINLLRMGKWELAGPDIAAHTETVKWVHYLASLMAEQLKGQEAPNPDAPAPAAPMKIKAMGPVGKNTKKRGKK